MVRDLNTEEYREKVLMKMLEYRKQYSPSEQWEILNALDWLYEEIRNIPTYSFIDDSFEEISEFEPPSESTSEVTLDDITNVVVRKVKLNRDNG